MKMAITNNSVIARTADITNITTVVICFDSSSIISGIDVDLAINTSVTTNIDSITVITTKYCTEYHENISFIILVKHNKISDYFSLVSTTFSVSFYLSLSP